MILDFEQVKSMTQGAERIELREGALRFFRFSETEESAYAAHPRASEFFERTFHTAGIRFSFYTDSTFLSFDYNAPDDVNKHPFDLYENRVFTRQVVCHTAYQKKGTICIPLTPGEKLVELYFPRSSYLPIANVSLSDGASFTPAHRKYRVISYGDSITHGSTSSHSSLSYAPHVARLLNADETNKGIGGEEYFPELIGEPASQTPDWITVAYGTNDWKHRTQEEFREKCELFLSRLSAAYPQTPIFVVTPSWRADANIETPFGAPADTVDAFVREIAAPFENVTVLSAWNMVPHAKEFFADNRLHPNDLGFCIYSHNLYVALRSLLEKKIGYTE